ncbi:MAG: hypothetical protein WC516_07565 [Patescibacteria group bacterium]
MLFFFIRILTVIIPVLYFVALRAMLYFNDSWYVFLLIVLAINLIYFWLLRIRDKKTRLGFLFFYSLPYVVAGFLYLLILENKIIITLFLLGWAFIYWLYLEAVFHYFFRTNKVLLIDLKHIVSYINAIVIFFLVATLVNFSIFLGLAWYIILPVMAVAVFILLRVLFSFEDLDQKTINSYAIIIDLLFIELLWSLLFLPVSFYVIALVMALTYYAAVSLSKAYLVKALNRKLVVKYLVFALIALVLVLGTATWI